MAEPSGSNKYLELMERLEAECKSGKSESCLAQPAQPMTAKSELMVQDPVVWGALIFVWVVIAMPAYFAETAAASVGRQQPSAQASARERRFTMLGLWWSLGLILLLGMWKFGTTALVAVSVMVLFVLLSLAARVVFSRRARSAVRTLVAKRHARIAISAVVLWILVVQSLGFVFRWGEHLTTGQFFALHVLPVLLGAFAYACARWVRNAR